MKKFLMASAAVASLLAAAPASAATIYNPGSQIIDVSTGSGTFGATITDNKPLGAAFSHLFSFVTSSLLTANGSVITIFLSGNNKPTDIDFSSITLDGHAFTKLTADNVPPGNGVESWALVPSVNLAAGQHWVSLKGTAYSTPQRAASYAGTINLSAALPEPGTWAMMLAGFGMVGAAMRRRKPTVRVRFA